MKLCRFQTPTKERRIGFTLDDVSVFDLTSSGISTLTSLLEKPDDLPARILELSKKATGRYSMDEVTLLAPVERQEIWAAGVTYLRSKKARMEESDFSATAYDRVYDAERPELFFKSLPEKVVATGEPVGIRRDARWNVPEPELALVINSLGTIVGYTICNDMSSRDIEGENLLYLPQAKIYDRSCAIGPWIRIGATENEARSWLIQMQIRRDNRPVFEGEIEVARIKRTFAELTTFLLRSQSFPDGVILSTGTGIIPPETFSLEGGDEIRITISGIGTLQNRVIRV